MKNTYPPRFKKHIKHTLFSPICLGLFFSYVIIQSGYSQTRTGSTPNNPGAVSGGTNYTASPINPVTLGTSVSWFSGGTLSVTYSNFLSSILDGITSYPTLVVKTGSNLTITGGSVVALTDSWEVKYSQKHMLYRTKSRLR